jgi:hypothetical protein
MKRLALHLVLSLVTFHGQPMSLAEPISLANRGLSLRFDSANARITEARSALTDEAYELAELTAFELQVDGERLGPQDMKLAAAQTQPAPRFVFQGHGLEVSIELLSAPDRDFIEKSLVVSNTGSAPRLIERVVMWRMQFKNLLVQPHRHPSVFASLINVFMSGEKGGLFVGVEIHSAR